MFFLNWLTSDNPNSPTAMLKAAFIAVCIGAVLFLTGCSGGESAGINTPPPCSDALIANSTTSNYTTAAGEVCNLVLTINGVTLTVTAGSALNNVTMTGNNNLIVFADGVTLAGAFDLVGNDNTLQTALSSSVTFANVVGSGNQVIRQ